MPRQPLQQSFPALPKPARQQAGEPWSLTRVPPGLGSGLERAPRPEQSRGANTPRDSAAQRSTRSGAKHGISPAALIGSTSQRAVAAMLNAECAARHQRSPAARLCSAAGRLRPDSALRPSCSRRAARPPSGGTCMTGMGGGHKGAGAGAVLITFHGQSNRTL